MTVLKDKIIKWSMIWKDMHWMEMQVINVQEGVIHLAQGGLQAVSGQGDSNQVPFGVELIILATRLPAAYGPIFQRFI